MKLVKFLLATLLVLAASVSELSAQSSSSATQTVTFGVTRMVPAFLASMQMTASTINGSRAVQSTAVKMTVGSETHSKQIVWDDQELNPSLRSSIVPLKPQKSKANKFFITVTE